MRRCTEVLAPSLRCTALRCTELRCAALCCSALHCAAQVGDVSAALREMLTLYFILYYQLYQVGDVSAALREMLAKDDGVPPPLEPAPVVSYQV